MYNILLGIFIGVTVCIFVIPRLLGRKKNLVGNIVVTEKEGITLFSLELDGDPQDLALKKEVTFGILIPDVESDRE